MIITVSEQKKNPGLIWDLKMNGYTQSTNYADMYKNSGVINCFAEEGHTYRWNDVGISALVSDF